MGFNSAFKGLNWKLACIIYAKLPYTEYYKKLHIKKLACKETEIEIEIEIEIDG